MNKNDLIVNFIRKMTKESAKMFALKFKIYFTDQEINLFLPYLQKNSPTLLLEKDINKKIHTDLDYLINVNSVNKLCLLINKLGY